NFTLQAIQLLFNESSKTTDSYALGGQASSKLQFGPWTTTPSFLMLRWENTDSLLNASAFAVQATTTGSSSTTTPVPSIPVPGEGPGCAGGTAGSSKLPSFAPCAFAANGMTNATVLSSAGTPTFLSQFFYADFILNNQVKTGISRLPLNILAEFEDNL